MVIMSEKTLKAAVISASVRDGRLSHRVSLCMQRQLEAVYASVDMLDLKTFNFPVLSERYAFLLKQDPAPDAGLMAALTDFRTRLLMADHIYIVSPVYNTSFPAALKNIVDAYYTEWQGKKTGVCTVSSGMVPGISALQQLQTLVMAMGATVAPGLFTITQVDKEFDEEGHVTAGTRNEKTLVDWVKAVRALG